MDPGRLDRLMDDYVEGEFTPAELAELETLLRDDAGLRRIFVERFLLEVQLRRAYSGFGARFQESRPRARKLPYFVGGAAAVILLGIALGLAFFTGDPEPVSPKPVNTVLSGTVMVNGQDAREVPEEALVEIPGDQPARLRLTDGSQMELAPASQALIHAKRDDLRLTVELKQGAGKFNVVKGEGKFRVDTTVGTVTALGTEFSVKLAGRGKARKKRDGKPRELTMTVSVTEGSVQVEVRGKTTLLLAGKSNTFGGRMREREREREEDD